MYALGLTLQVYIEDLRDDFVENYVFWSVKVGNDLRTIIVQQ